MRKLLKKWWFWVVIFFVVLVGGLLINKVYWQSRVRNRLAEIRRAGYPTNCKELNAWYKPVPAQENAANVVLAAAGRFVKWKDKNVPESMGDNSDGGDWANFISGKSSEVTIAPGGMALKPKPPAGKVNWPIPAEIKKQRLPRNWDKNNNRLLPYLEIL